jgi:hypothetical protein
VPDFAIDYSLLHGAKKDLHDLADRIGPKLKDTAFAQAATDYSDADVFGNAQLAASFRSLYRMAKHPMSEAEDKLRQLGDIFGAVADAYFDVDAQIADGMGMMGANLGLDDWRRRKEMWDYLQGHRDECVPGPDGKLPDFCGATDPGPPPSDYTVQTPNGSVTTHLTYDANHNVIKEDTTVVNGDQHYTSSTTYSADHKTQTTDTSFTDGSTTHSVTTFGDHGSSVTDTSSSDGSTTHTEITLNDGGGGTMAVTESGGKKTEYSRTDQYAPWVVTSEYDPANDPPPDYGGGF